jgi:hypothetical protein
MIVTADRILAAVEANPDAEPITTSHWHAWVPRERYERTAPPCTGCGRVKPLKADGVCRACHHLRERDLPVAELPHGTYSHYIHHHCRCHACTDAMRRYTRARRAMASAGALPPGTPHGKQNTYVNLGCRCRPCTDANTAACLRSRRRSRGLDGAA